MSTQQQNISAELATSDYFRDLATRLSAAGHGKCGELINGAANMLNISKQQVYRNLKQVGWTSGRKHRTDKGESEINESEIKFIVNLILEAARNNKDNMLTWEDAVDIAREHGAVKSNCHPSTYSRVALSKGLHPNQLRSATPHQDMRSLYPNHVWQFDVSICVLYYMDDSGLKPMDKKKFYKNKPEYMEGIKKKRCLRYVMVDHASGAIFLKYYVAAGEDQETLFEFLMDAFTENAHPQDPFHGVPSVIIADAGAANKSHLITNLLQQLGVRYWQHMPGSARVTGSVEGAHQIVERRFESRLSMLTTENVDQLNDHAHKWMRWFNGTRKHSRHGHTRYGMWQTIRENQLRICPPREVCEALLQTKPESRKVAGNLTISYAIKGYGTKTYSVRHVPDIRVGDMVMVTVNPYEAPNVFVIEEGEHAKDYISCEPLEKDEFGFNSDGAVWLESFGNHADTTANTTRKDMLKEAYGVETSLEVDKARSAKAPTFEGKVDPMTYMDDQHTTDYMKRRGTELNVPDRVSVEVQAMSMTAAIKQLIADHNITVDNTTRKLLADGYPGGIFETDLDDAAERLNGWTEENIGLRLVN